MTGRGDVPALPCLPCRSRRACGVCERLTLEPTLLLGLLGELAPNHLAPGHEVPRCAGIARALGFAGRIPTNPMPFVMGEIPAADATCLWGAIKTDRHGVGQDRLATALPSSLSIARSLAAFARRIRRLDGVALGLFILFILDLLRL